MNIQKFTITSIAFLLGFASITAQTISSTIIDKKTNQPIPYATIEYAKNQGVITNEEGKFSFTLDKKITKTDSIYVSSMGYEKVIIPLGNATDSIIYIEPKAIELSGVFITNKNLTIDEIMDNVKERLDQNYNKDLSHKKLFLRESDFTDINKINVKLKKSTIEEFDREFIDSVISIIPRKSSYYTESLCDFYGNFEKQKLGIVKGAELYDKSNDGSMNALSDRLENILKKNVKQNSYLKIKSGWLPGAKIQVDSIIQNNAEAAEVKEELEDKDKSQENHFHKYRKSTIEGLLSNIFFQEDSKLNFIDKSGRYKFEVTDYTTIDDSSVYIINFEPKRGADFKGTLFINTEDFAIMRVDYENVKNLRNFSLLGISFYDTLYKGKTIFAKGSDGKYNLKYIEKTRGNVFGIDRPLKIVEKNKYVKGKRKQNELSVALDIGAGEISKYELVVFDSQSITEGEYETSKENEVIQPQYLSKYDPEFWKGHNIIEPNTAIKEFTVLEGEES
ncbi:carboxypeptidase-like regulatory domain-containing protein [Aquimarina sp. MMG016]|uniref:carboxypeptidase-like regulatory domain-containing protein n=1 Tax=Aquimarina sp. MMG016 TaxID=2822690 RepID=UPI001B3A5363|nr:carboxypeptidase-like regulatory domain-containing protein [Aquimarina sp. MMG016]MBQ4822049.1 carboxypeptidase-like regulatory domain-containing protein [Aquimarina sp. MMG016]